MKIIYAARDYLLPQFEFPKSQSKNPFLFWKEREQMSTLLG